LLVACAPTEAAGIMNEIHSAGYAKASIIAEMTQGTGASVI
jgi:hypothetical protein